MRAARAVGQVNFDLFRINASRPTSRPLFFAAERVAIALDLVHFTAIRERTS